MRITREYTCAICAGTFENTFSEEELEQEYAERFPEAKDAERATVCADCFPQFLAWRERRV